MNAAKMIFQFTIKFLIIYILLLVLAFVTNFDKKASIVFGNTAASFFNLTVGEAEFTVFPIEDKKEDNNLRFQILNKEKVEEIKEQMRKTGKKNLDVETMSYNVNANKSFLIPWFFLLALILAYPSNIKRKLVPILLGTIILLIYTIIELRGAVIIGIDDDAAFFPNFELSTFSRLIYGFLDQLFIETTYLIAALIWGIVCFRLEDFKGS